MSDDTFEIKPRTSVGQIQKHIGLDDRQALKESQQRRDHLEKLAIMHTGEPIYVEISGDQAYADIATRDSRMGHTDRIVINVRLEIPEQTTTNLDEKVWDMMVQKTDLYHEMGHVLWTDWPSFENVLLGDGDGNLGITEEHQSMFKNWWDHIEDAAVERLLIGDFDIEDDLRVVNENILQANKPDKTVSLHEATSMALIEYKHPVGWVDRLLDEQDDAHQFLTTEDRKIFEENIYPVIEDLVPTIVEEGDPVTRNLLIYNLYRQIGIYIDVDPNDPDQDHDTVPMHPGLDEDQSFGFNQDADDQGAGGQGQPPQGGMPDISLPGPAEPKKIDVDHQQDYSKQVDQQQNQADPNKQVEDAEKWARVIDDQYDQDVDMSLQIPNNPPDKGTFDQNDYSEARRLSNPLAKELGNRLQQQTQSQKQPKQSSGKPDTKRLKDTKRGKTNVFKRTSQPDEKEYSCMLVLDRSGSMGSKMMPEAEKAAGALALALEDIGVDIGQISLTESECQLEKDFGETVDEAKKKMFRQHSGGGTPLSDALALARARLSIAGDSPFVIVITDGEPDHRERYRDQLHQCDFPVVGIYIEKRDNFDEDKMNEAGYFHKLEMRQYKNTFDGVRNMVKGVMF